jgi:hypothetical protein
MKITTLRCLFTSALLAFAFLAARDRGPWPAAYAASSQQKSDGGKADNGADKNLSPEERMQRRFPHPVRVGFLVGLPVIDNDDNTLGYVQRVVRTPAGKVHLIVRYGGWFGWIGWWQRPVAVPVELVGMLGAAVAALEMFPADFRQAPTWSAGDSLDLGPHETIKVALTKR